MELVIHVYDILESLRFLHFYCKGTCLPVEMPAMPPTGIGCEDVVMVKYNGIP